MKEISGFAEEPRKMVDCNEFWQCSIQRCRSGRRREREGFYSVEQMKEVGFLEASEKDHKIKSQERK